MIFLVNLPPPLHGMSYINLQMLELAKENNIKIEMINTAPSGKLISSNFKKAIMHASLLLKYLNVLMNSKDETTIYRPINGGKGQLIDICYLLLGRLFKKKFILHHHSYNYINNKSILFKMICHLLNDATIHIVLSDDMKDKLCSLYTINTCKVDVLSNIGFISKQIDYSRVNESDDVIISYMSNVTKEKGVDVFIKICNVLEENSHRRFKYKIAGPISDDISRELISEFTANNKNAEYIGPVYGEYKTNFLLQSDIFIFPSKYKNEAEPLVLYEAAACKCLVIGSQAGSMKDAINSIAGESFPLDVMSTDSDTEKYISDVSAFISNISNDELMRRKIKAVETFEQTCISNQQKIIKILNRFR
ncbi:TPA: glycosyltransferase family 4 protein [Raoultella ornithinolytica]|nr:glycosyltransferase family 4 protein [Raoultella ornithinolytica]